MYYIIHMCIIYGEDDSDDYKRKPNAEFFAAHLKLSPL